MITIGIPFYNAENFLASAIKSVIAQSYPYWELILVDDGSTDNSLSIAQLFAQQDSRIRVITDGKNKKLPARLNQIIQEAKYDYIARMDADDLIHTQRFEKQINFLIENPQYDLVSTSILSIKSNDALFGIRTYHQKNLSKKDALMGATGIVHASILAKREWYLRNLYNEKNLLAEDYELWLKSSIKNDLRVGFLQDYLYYYREDGNVTKTKMIRGYNTQIETIKKYYQGILSEYECKRVIKRIEFKKGVVNILNVFGLMSLLLKQRNRESLTEEIKQVYKKQLNLIQKVKL